MKMPIIRLATFDDKVKFLLYIYDHGIDWVGYSRANALDIYSPRFDVVAKYWGAVLTYNGTAHMITSHEINPECHLPTNSPAQFVRAAKRLYP